MRLRPVSSLLFVSCLLLPLMLHARTREPSGAETFQEKDPNKEVRGGGSTVAREAALKARQLKVDQAQRELKRCQSDLQKAEAKGNAEKIDHQRKKVEKALKDLETAQAELLR